MRKTKIVCTLGPSTDKYESILKLLKCGMNVARLNMSHGDLVGHQNTLYLVIRAREQLSVPCAIMVDTCGPELRIGVFKNQKVLLKKGGSFTFTTNDVLGDESVVSLNYPELLKTLKKGQKMYANNGLLEFKIQQITNSDIVCTVTVGGELSNHKSVSIPHVRLPLPFISEKDEKNIEFAVKNNVEYISASFVSSKEDVLQMRECIKKYGGSQEIISKIESLEGIKNLDSIIEVSDGIMVARGDMGTEIPIEQIPAVQKTMIQKCISSGKKVIVATEMLESMIYKRRPTRAETTDVAQAIYDKSGSTMLSGETASGNYPFDAVSTMSKIATATERVVNYDSEVTTNYKPVHKNLNAIAYSASATARAIGAKAIVCYTDKGKTANMISRFRPKAPIVAITHDRLTYNKLSLTWGVVPVMVSEQQTIDDMLKTASKIVKSNKLANAGDKIIVTLGIPTNEKGTTNAVHIYEVN